MKQQTRKPKRTTNTQAILLCRASSSSDEGLASLKAQRAIGTAYAKQLGLTITKTYKVDGLKSLRGRLRWSDFILRVVWGEETHILLRGADQFRNWKDWASLLAAAKGKKKILHLVNQRASYDLGAGLNLEGIHGIVCPAIVSETAERILQKRRILSEVSTAI